MKRGCSIRADMYVNESVLRENQGKQEEEMKRSGERGEARLRQESAQLISTVYNIRAVSGCLRQLVLEQHISYREELLEPGACCCRITDGTDSNGRSRQPCCFTFFLSYWFQPWKKTQNRCVFYFKLILILCNKMFVFHLD